MRDTFKAKKPGMSFGHLAKFTSSMYSQITAEEKKVWEARAQADKKRYILELSECVPPPGFDGQGYAIAANAHNTRNTRLRKKTISAAIPNKTDGAGVGDAGTQ